jgi:16S rRNA (adenine1518-N6/adenine1519-N6)-dimethyltransferase
VTRIKPKKSLGQHYLTDKNIALKIVNSLSLQNYDEILEIGPGLGVLSGTLLTLADKNMKFVEIDKSSVEYLNENFPAIRDKIFTGDVLKISLGELFNGPFAVIGNFPYNISSQLFFKILENRQQVIEVVCMLQKEVAIRIASPPGSRDYGILSVFLQAYYQIEYLFSVPPQVFYPPPRVQSAVIRLKRNERLSLPCDETLFISVVKSAFNQRRKVLRNSLKSFFPATDLPDDIFRKRPEQLSVDDFIRLTRLAENHAASKVNINDIAI